MLVGEKYFIKVHRNIDLVVGEVPEPSAVRANGIGKQWENFHQRDVYRVADFSVCDLNRGGLFLGTVIDTKMIGTHSGDSFLA
jgi:hypothetical protein